MWWVVISTLWLGAAPAGGGESAQWHRLVAAVQYVEGDYPAALESGSETEFQEQLGLLEEALKQARQLGSTAEVEAAALTRLRAAIATRAPAPEVAAACQAIVTRAIADGHVTATPRHRPDVTEGQGLFERHCVACHGATGDANTEVARTLKPPPANLREAWAGAHRTPFRVFNVLSFGIPGTAMPSWETLTDQERWSLAFYVVALRHPPCERPAQKRSLQELATTDDEALTAAHGADALACLRWNLPRADERGALAETVRGIDDAIANAQRGDLEGARTALVDAYLTHFEVVEPSLKARNPAAVAEIEAAFTRARESATRSVPLFITAATVLRTAVDHEHHGAAGAGAFWSIVLAVTLILLREGFEATVVVGALFAVLKKLNATSHIRIVHAGWLSALLVGGLVFAFGHALISGANREWVETGVAFVAVVLLLYAALWLNSRANTSKWMGELRGQMTSALGATSGAGVFLVAFTSVGRETVETALFLQNFALDSVQATWAGVGIGAIALTGLLLFVRTVGFRLPMKTLFSVSTVLLLVMAVALLGQGVHGLEELGVLEFRSLFGTNLALPLLGLYDDQSVLGAQAALAVALGVSQRRPPNVTRPAAPQKAT